MSRHQKINNKHDRIVNNLEDRLSNVDSVIEKFIEYEGGEIDLYRYLPDNKIIEYYEIKCNLTDKGIKKATKQLNRHERVYNHRAPYPILETRKYLVTGIDGSEEMLNITNIKEV